MASKDTKGSKWQLMPTAKKGEKCIFELAMSSFALRVRKTGREKNVH